MNDSTYIKHILLCLLLTFTVRVVADSPVLAVASNLTAPLTQIASEFEANTGTKLRLTFGSSGSLSRQIIQGAPFELFISANAEFVDLLLREGVINSRGWAFAEGPIGVFIPRESTLYTGASLTSVLTALKYSAYRKLALANPKIAPYGAAAIRALQSGGIWVIEQARTLLAEDVSQVVPYALSGNVDIAVIPYSFMRLENMKDRGIYIPFPDTWYQPVTQYVVLLDKASEITREFEQFLGSDRAHAILRDYGYNIPVTQ